MSSLGRRKQDGRKHILPRKSHVEEANAIDFVRGYLTGVSTAPFRRYNVAVGYADDVLECGRAFAVTVTPVRNRQAQPSGDVISQVYCDLSGMQDALGEGTAAMRLEMDDDGTFRKVTFALAVEPESLVKMLKTGMAPA